MRKTVYCAQAFWRRDGQWLPGCPYHTHREDRARERGARFARSAHSVVVYRIEADPAAETFGEPVVLERFGEEISAGS